MYFDDIEVGARRRFGSYRVTREEVIDFATRYDPQPFHLSDEAGAASPFGRLAASGWHSCAMAMRMMVDNFAGDDAGAQIGLGVDELRWLKPVYPGDMLSCEAEVVEKTESRTKPGSGTFRDRVTVSNQAGAPVLSFVTIVLAPRRPA